jgi:hypothetical protein
MHFKFRRPCIGLGSFDFLKQTRLSGKNSEKVAAIGCPFLAPLSPDLMEHRHDIAGDDV